jgi:hypothetical protein
MAKKIVEVDEEDFLRMQKLQQTIGAVMSNPKAAVLAEQATKLVFPDARTPNIEQQALRDQEQSGLLETVKGLKKDLDDERAERERVTKINDLNSKVEKGISELRAEGWTVAGIEGVRKIMEETGVLDPHDAAGIFARRNPPQDLVTPGGSSSWNFMEPPPDDQADLKKLIESRGQNDQIVDKMARGALADMRGQARR